MKKKRKIIKLLSAVMSFVIALLAIVILYAALSVNNKELFGIRLFVVSTGSMGETIPQGNLIITRQTISEELGKGDIITFRSTDPAISGQTNTHRIHGIENGLYRTKGDASEQVDQTLVSYDDVYGKVVFSSAIAGKVIRFLSKPLYMLLIIVAPIVVLALLDMRKAMAAIKKKLSEEKQGEGPEGTPAEEKIEADRPLAELTQQKESEDETERESQEKDTHNH